MSKVTLLFFFLCVWVCSTTEDSGYYWKINQGIIPEDALEGAVDKEGSPVYIGQVYYIHLLIPGPIFQINGSTKMYFDYDHSEESRNDNFKILCTKHPERYQWVQSNNTHMEVLEEEGNLVIGGYAGKHTGKSTYIGRKFINGQTMIGKVQASYDKNAGLHVTDTKKGVYLYDTFEVLIYNSLPIEIEEPVAENLIQKFVTEHATKKVEFVTEKGTKEVEFVTEKGTKEVEFVTEKGTKEVEFVTEKATKEVEFVTEKATKEDEFVTENETKEDEFVTENETKEDEFVTENETKEDEFVTENATKEDEFVTENETKEVEFVTENETKEVKVVTKNINQDLEGVPENHNKSECSKTIININIS